MKSNKVNYADLLKSPKVREPSFLLVLLIRIAVAVLLFFHPLLAMILWWVTDNEDVVVWMKVNKLTHMEYEVVDKFVDLIMYVSMLIFSLQYGVDYILIGLFLYRILGQIIFWAIQNERIFVLFPNIFESYWLWAILLPLLKLPSYLGFLYTAFGLILFIAIKLMHELSVHFFGDSFVFPLVDKYFWKNVSRIKKVIKI